ncbi:MAG: ABC transporter permease [Planctomycetaceae bacterium]
MNISHNTIFWRLMWKEYRSQRGLWIGVAALAVFVQAVMLAVSRDRVFIVNDVYFIALILPVLYALASTAVLFAAEKEEGTFELLRSLPVTPQRLFAAKLCFCLCTSLAMLLVLHAIAWVIVRGNSPSIHPRHVELIPMVLVTGVFFSLMMNRVLNVLVATAVVVLVLNLNNMPTLKWGSMIAFVLADVWLVRRWFLDGSLVQERIGHLLDRLRLPTRSRDRTVVLAKTETSSPTWRAWKRMSWLEYRHARMTLFVWFPLALFLVFSSQRILAFIGVDFTYVVIPIAPLLLGLAVFRGHQRDQRVRFLAEHGVSPSLVWAGTQVVWVTIAVVMLWSLTAATLLVQNWAADGHFGLRENIFDFLALDLDRYPFNLIDRSGGISYEELQYARAKFYFWFAAITFAAGQLCSFSFRRTVTAAMAALILAAAGYLWMSLLLRLPMPYFVAAAPLVLIWWLIPLFGRQRWVLGSHTWKTRLRGAGGIVAVHGLYLCAIVGVRMIDVPESEAARLWVNRKMHQYPAVAPVTGNEATEGKTFLKATELLSGDRPSHSPDVREKLKDDPDELLQLDLAWLADNQAVLNQVVSAIEAGEMPGGALYEFEHLLFLSAAKLTRDGKLDEALQRYEATLKFARLWAARDTRSVEYPQVMLDNWEIGVHINRRVYNEFVEWAGHEQQTAERLRSVPPMLERHRVAFPSLAERWAEYYAFFRRELLREENGWNQLDTMGHSVYSALLMLPWEQARLMRILDADAQQHHFALDVTEKILFAPSREGEPDTLRHNPVGRFRALNEYNAIPDDRMRLLFRRNFDTEVQALVDQEAAYRACRLSMELLARRLENGMLPAKLIEAIPNLALSDLFDPWSGQPFAYYPQGIPNALIFPKGTLQTGQPFVWSVGSDHETIIPFEHPRTHETLFVVGKGNYPLNVGALYLEPKDYIPYYPHDLVWPLPLK